MDNFSLGNGDTERGYRKWCLKNCLFLNPLNDLGEFNIASHDILSCPSIYTPMEDSSHYPPVYFGFCNQLKQEYVSARYFLYDSMQNKPPHYSDKEVQLYNTFDYPCYGLNTEQIKAAFKMSYAIFDKIAFFINDYLKLNVPENRVSFKTIWYEKQKKHHGLRKEFVHFENWPLQGLFWLAKDLSENRPEFHRSIEPDAQDLAKIRNHLEHKYLTISDDCFDVEEIREGMPKNVYRISREDFLLKTLKLLKLVRAALIYLSLGIHVEERKKTSVLDRKKIGTMFLDVWEDDWKN